MTTAFFISKSPEGLRYLSPTRTWESGRDCRQGGVEIFRERGVEVSKLAKTSQVLKNRSFYAKIVILRKDVHFLAQTMQNSQ